MAIKNFVFSIYGTVADKNGSVSNFGAWFDSQNKVLLSGNQAAFATLFPSKTTPVRQLFQLVSPSTISFTNPSTSNVVNSFNLVMTGIVAYDDNTTKHFAFESREGVRYSHVENGNYTFDELISNSTARTAIDDLLTDIIGGSVSLIPD